MTQNSTENDERAIRDLVATWMEASRAGDTATVLSLMADDVVFQVPGREPFGKEAFAAMSQGMKGVRMEGSSDIRELRVLGDWAYLRNHITITVTPPGGKPVKRAGYTLTILRKQTNGQWLLARDANLLTEVKDATKSACATPRRLRSRSPRVTVPSAVAFARRFIHERQPCRLALLPASAIDRYGYWSSRRVVPAHLARSIGRTDRVTGAPINSAYVLTRLGSGSGLRRAADRRRSS